MTFRSDSGEGQAQPPVFVGGQGGVVGSRYRVRLRLLAVQRLEGTGGREFSAHDAAGVEGLSGT
jgi:hypothetical protein